MLTEAQQSIECGIEQEDLGRCLKPNVLIVGSGRVGLPFGLYLYSKGCTVYFVDKDLNIRSAIENGFMPFMEPGFDDLIFKYSEENHAYESISELPAELIKSIEHVVITVGTPVSNHIETDLSYVMAVFKELADCGLIYSKNLILRSTVAPETTDAVIAYLAQRGYVLGDHYNISMCPERLAEGKACVELESLTQLIGLPLKVNYDYPTAMDLFSAIGVKYIEMNSTEAELAKIFSNVYRYVNFAIANYFYYIANGYMVDFNKLLPNMKDGYPRNAGLPSAGLTAGTCLRKDFGMLAENSYGSDLLMGAYRVNEYMPKFMVNQAAGFVRGGRISVVGLSFKENTDDVRDSLAFKLIRYIAKEIPESICVHDHLCLSRSVITQIRQDTAGAGSLTFTDKYNFEEYKPTHIFIAAPHDIAVDEVSRYMQKVRPTGDWPQVIDPWGRVKS